MPDIDQRPSGLTALAVFAHPDDEGFSCGGTLAKLVALGIRVTVVCATNGDVGEISDPSLATPETLAQVRKGELRRAMTVTGVPDLRFLDYRDSGMEGSTDNQHPNSLRQAQEHQVIQRLSDIINEVRPALVITHDPTGGYGHPDHIAVYRLVTHAFSSTGPGEGGATSLETGGPRFLYYSCFPRSVFRKMWQAMLDAGITPPFASQDADSIGTPDDLVTTTLDVGEFVETKIASLKCHRTQIDPEGFFTRLPKDVMRELMSTEYFTLALAQGSEEGADLLAAL
ncbi:MAG: PIG-L family deacetylase [Chloroflexi bacterium]|nr:PIG-L family deacetylase [Chloroflexota bacterium]